MEFEPTAIPGVILVKPRVFTDARGFFFESWRQDKFEAAGISANFVQDNHSHSVRHTLRGLHYQIQQPQGKLVRVTRGEAFDVAVDIRRSSRHFGQWVGVHLSETNRHMLWVPPGFAHGYLALSETVDFLYKCTDVYAPQHERAIRWNDAAIDIQWPLPPGTNPLQSAPDATAPMFQHADYFP